MKQTMSKGALATLQTTLLSKVELIEPRLHFFYLFFLNLFIYLSIFYFLFVLKDLFSFFFFFFIVN